MNAAELRPGVVLLREVADTDVAALLDGTGTGISPEAVGRWADPISPEFELELRRLLALVVASLGLVGATLVVLLIMMQGARP